MSARNFIQAFTAGQTIRFPAGRYFMIRQATAVLDIATEGNPGSPITFTGIPAGSVFGPVAEGEGWRFLAVTSATIQTVEIVISDDGDFGLAQQVSVSGTVVTQDQPSSTYSTTVAETALATGNSADIAANASRRRLTIQASSTNTGSLWVRDQTATTNGGTELQPGQSVEVRTVVALRIRNNSGASQSYSVTEEA